MKYKYLYQTKDNENRHGWIDARDRADAYTRLRKQGIRPYRVIGEDPFNYRPWAIGAGFVLMAAALVASVAMLASGSFSSHAARQQLTGDRAVIAAGFADSWEGVFDLMLDRYLAAYAQPGWIALPPELDESQLAAFAEELERPSRCRRNSPEARLLHRIVLAMREEMRTYLAAGGTVKDYLTFLDERQDQERDFRNRAIDSVARAPESLRARARMNVNTRLREMGLAEIGE